MKKFVYMLNILILFCFLGVDCTYSNDSKIQLTEKQKDYVNEILKEPGVSKVEWISTFQLDVTSGVYTKELGTIKAIYIAEKGYLYTTQNICVNIISSKFGDLAYQCTGDQSET